VHQNLKLAVLVRVYLGLQKGALSAKYGSIASEKQRSCGEKETEEIWRNLGSDALVVAGEVIFLYCTRYLIKDPATQLKTTLLPLTVAVLKSTMVPAPSALPPASKPKESVLGGRFLWGCCWVGGQREL
jgi:hypothetical protein